MTGEAMTQAAPFPTVLAGLVDGLTYKPGWTFTLRHMVREHEDPADETTPALSEGLTLDVVSLTHDSHHPERGCVYRVHHYVIVPPATFNRASWQRWLLEQLLPHRASRGGRVLPHRRSSALRTDPRPR